MRTQRPIDVSMAIAKAALRSPSPRSAEPVGCWARFVLFVTCRLDLWSWKRWQWTFDDDEPANDYYRDMP